MIKLQKVSTLTPKQDEHVAADQRRKELPWQ